MAEEKDAKTTGGSTGGRSGMGQDAAGRAADQVQRGGDVAEQAARRGADMADRATERIRAAGDRAGDLADKAADTAGDLGTRVDEAKDMARDMAQDAIPQAKDAAYGAVESGRESAAGLLEQASDRLAGGEMAPGGMRGMAASGIDTAAGYLRQHETSEMVDDLETYVRAHPMQSVAAAIAAGFVVGRILR